MLVNILDLFHNNKKQYYEKQENVYFVLDKVALHDCRNNSNWLQQLATIKELQLEFKDQRFEVSLTIFNDQVDHVLSHVAIAAFERLTYADINQMVEPLTRCIGLSINQIRIANETKSLMTK
jgi:hypothetical protein